MRILLLKIFLFLFVCAPAQEVTTDVSYKYIFADKWDKAIQTYNFSRPFLEEKQPLFVHGVNGSLSYIFVSNNKFKQGINACYSYFQSYSENPNFVNILNLHFLNVGYVIRFESYEKWEGLCTDLILAAVSSALFRNVNEEPFVYDDIRAKAFGVGGDISLKTSYSFSIKNNMNLSPFFQVGYTPYLFSPKSESIINQTSTLVSTNHTGIFTTQIGLTFRMSKRKNEQ
jgi:hypothetical protein